MIKLVDVGSIRPYFESLSDPRLMRNRKHLLVDIAVIAFRAIVCGCDVPTAIHRWAKHRQSWLSPHLALPNGIPSRDCIRRLLVVLKPEAFQRCLQARIADAIPIDADASGRLMAIDGKSCRGSHDGAKGLGALPIVGAWASEQGIAPGQVATDAKSNEITAIPPWLGQIDLAGTLITIDAMGCQKEIVEQVVAGGDRVIAVKGNQPKLLAAIRTHFLDQPENDPKELQYRYHETLDTIPQDRLLALVAGKVSDGRVLSLIEAFLHQGVLDGLEEWTPEQGTPQGAVITPPTMLQNRP